MNPNNNSSPQSDNGRASASREPLSGPGEGRAFDNRLHEIDLEARGESLEDHQRDRDSKGVADGYDDSVERRKGQNEGRDYKGIARGD